MSELIIIRISKIIRKYFSKLLSDKQFILIDYYSTYGKVLNLQRPKTISEKIQWIKLYGGLEKYSKYADKYAVRNFISKTIGNEHLIPLIGVWDRFEDIPFDKLPDQFVLKATHGSGYIFICKDKSSVDMKKLNRTVSKWMYENFYKITREVQYRDCKPRIICEKYMEDETEGLTDYKIYCSDGKAYIIELIWDRFTEHKCDVFLDLDWKKLPIYYPEHPLPVTEKIREKPENLPELIMIAEKLSKNIPFVRVDLYSVKDKIYFGELTITPDNGVGLFAPPNAFYQLGKLIDISKYNIL